MSASVLEVHQDPGVVRCCRSARSLHLSSSYMIHLLSVVVSRGSIWIYCNQGGDRLSSSMRGAVGPGLWGPEHPRATPAIDVRRG